MVLLITKVNNLALSNFIAFQATVDFDLSDGIHTETLFFVARSSYN